jgi:peptidoglycan/xylan/chitin deacetylase (PgdA/CDA1 family)
MTQPSGSIARTRLRRAGLAILALIVLGLGLRQVTNASTFQPFGDYVARLDTVDRVVALTFDDGPDPQHTPPILDALDAQGVKATFFMMGRNVERHPEVAREVLRRGHEIGNHSYSHPRLVLMSPRRVREEIERTDRLLTNLGVRGPIHFRPPHMSKLIVLPYVLGQMDKLTVLADVDPEEWRRRPAEVMIPEVLRQVRPGSIISMHDTFGEETLSMVERVVAALVEDGYRFETVSELLRRRN